MKKVLFLLAAGLFAHQTMAADVETLKIDGSNTWNATPVAGVRTPISFSSNWGEFKLISSSITKTAYKGFKVEFSDLVDAEGGGIHLKIGKAVMDGEKDKGVYEYFNFSSATDGVLSGEFADDLDDEIATFNVQCTKAGESITITKFTLIKADDTEEVAESLGGVSWGCTAQQDVSGLTFTGQWGNAKIVAADGSSLTYDPVTEKDIVYTYNIELAAAAGATLVFEVDKAKEDGSDTGMKWINVAADQTTITFEVSASTCTSAVTNIYVKADQGDETVYPFTVNFKSITRTKVDNSVNTDLNKYSILRNTQVILKSDLEKFDATDKVVFSYSYEWDDTSVNFNGWGMGGIRSAADNTKNLVEIKGTSAPGTYEYVTTVGDLIAMCGHHSAEGEGENKDNTEWDGLYWFMWNNTNGNVVCTTTKIGVTVYSSKDVTIDPDKPTSVKDAEAQLDVVSAEYYNLMGVKSAAPVHGVNIVRQTLSDGSVRTVKTFVK